MKTKEEMSYIWICANLLPQFFPFDVRAIELDEVVLVHGVLIVAGHVVVGIDVEVVPAFDVSAVLHQHRGVEEFDLSVSEW